MMTRLAKRQVEQRHPQRHLFYPLDPWPKLTIIGDGILVPPGCSRLPHTDPLDPRQLHTETLAAPASLLLSLGEGWMPKFPLIVFTGKQYGFLGEAERERLWRRFAVPIFEQLVDEQGRVFATECEAHEGVHVSDDAGYSSDNGEVLLYGRRTGIAGHEATGLCGCGQIGLRLLDAALKQPLEVGPALRLLADVQN